MTTTRLVAALPFSLLLLTGSAAVADENGIEFFEKKIRPVLAKHCYECHSPDAKSVKGGLRVDHRQAMLDGGESGEAVVPGEPEESLLISSLRYESFEMPPTGKLPDAVIADFEKWVEMGAPAPESKGVPTAGDEPTATSVDLWSLEPVADVAPPAVENDAWPRRDIDRFVLARLEARGLGPVGGAEKITLLRRLHFDLVGLPPTPEQQQAFLEDDSRDAVAHVVDELLASPAFGERWARHWLDVARYGESNGKSRDVLMPHAWRYRDWVIDALNADLPYDEFITQQIAGDLLPHENVAERDRQRTATGLLAIGSKPLVGGNLQMDLVDDQIDVVSKAFLGLTVSCARCHDHKFDPIPTRDYYALAGIFLSSDTRYGGGLKKPKNETERVRSLLPLGENVDEALAVLAEYNERMGDLVKRGAAAKKRVQQFSKGESNKNRAAKLAAAKAEVAELQKELKALNKEKPDVAVAFACGVVEGKPTDCRIRVRGEKGKLGESVPRGFLSNVSLEVPAIDPEQSGRLQLARFITHPENPLTSRVAVNRVWHHLFGAGLVETVDNFGNTGSKPTHPELLDFLARRFVENGWSRKQLIREIVLSRTYQLASDLDEANNEVDPGNTLLWRASRRRLEAEAIRDAMLAASGQLELKRPEASAVARIGDGEVGRGIDESPLSEPFPHRSVYLPVIRGIVPEFLKTFDFPEPSNVLGRRSTTNVPTQSLFLLNSPFVIEQAGHLADRALADAADDDAAITAVYQHALGRKPSDVERGRAIDFLSGHAAQLDAKNPRREAFVSLSQALFASAEFRFVE